MYPPKPIAFITLVILLLIVAACGSSSQTSYQLSGKTMGTQFNVSIVANIDDSELTALQAQIESLLDQLNSLFSTYDIDSELGKFNQSNSTEWLTVSAELCGAVANSLAISQLTNGAFDATVGTLVNLWGFGPGDNPMEPPSDAAIANALAVTGYRNLHASCDVPAIRKDHADLYVDLSAYAKGLAVDEVAYLLDAKGLTDYLVEIGGELRARGNNATGAKWRIAIEKPLRTNRTLQTTISIDDHAIATSGDYRNFFEFEGRFYSHTINPQTGRPLSHNLAAVTVVNERAAFADAMATALLAMGAESALEFAEREEIACLLILRNQDQFVERTSSHFAKLSGRQAAN